MSATTTAPQVETNELIGAFEVIRRANRLHNLVDVLTEAGVGQATGYRRIAHPHDLKYGEIVAVAHRFGVPAHILTEGELATLRYIKHGTGPNGPGTPSDLAGQSSPCMTDVIDLSARRGVVWGGRRAA